MLYNIMIINLAYIEIDKFKLDRHIKYHRVMKDLAQYKILENNEVRCLFIKPYRSTASSSSSTISTTVNYSFEYKKYEI